MKVRVLLFAAAREGAGRGIVDQELSMDATLQDLEEALSVSYPALREMRLKFAVNATYAGPETVLHDGDEVACIPPVGGG
jgi:molybdopterin converting factor subunit 1